MLKLMGKKIFTPQKFIYLNLWMVHLFKQRNSYAIAGSFWLTGHIQMYALSTVLNGLREASRLATSLISYSFL